MTKKYFLCQQEDLLLHHARGFQLEEYDKKIFLVHNEQGMFAYWDACPHYPSGTPLPWKKDEYLSPDKKHIVCYAHKAMFNIQTGECTKGVCLGQALVSIPLSQYDGSVFADLSKFNFRRKK